MEEFIVNRMIRAANDNGFQTVIGEYLKTPKNTMVAEIYEKLGFKRVNDTQFIAEVSEFEPNKTYIMEE